MIERGVIDFIPPEQVDDGSWLEDPEFAREFIPIQMLFLQRNHVTIDPTMSAERQKASQYAETGEVRPQRPAHRAVAPTGQQGAAPAPVPTPKRATISTLRGA